MELEQETTPDCDVAYRLREISRNQVAAQRERKALDRRARLEGGIVKNGIIVRRKH